GARAEVVRIVAGREGDRIEHLLVVRQRVGARQRQRLGGRIVARRDGGAGRDGGQHVAVAREGAADDLHRGAGEAEAVDVGDREGRRDRAVRPPGRGHGGG